VGVKSLHERGTANRESVWRWWVCPTVVRNQPYTSAMRKCDTESWKKPTGRNKQGVPSGRIQWEGAKASQCRPYANADL